MIRKLRKRFILLTVGSLFLVLAVTMGIANLLNYKNIVSRADALLSVLTENNGSFPAIVLPAVPVEGEAEEEFDHRRFSPETPFESRFFYAFLNEDGELTTSNTGRIAAIDTDTAMEYARQVWEGESSRGFMKQYRYMKAPSEEGTLIVFLDCSRDLQAVHNFMRNGFGVAVLILLAVFLLVYLLSGRMVKPVLEGYEKQKQFITDAGHELKTPLAIIDADTDVLEMEIGENEWLEDIRRQTGRLAVLTRDLIYLARMEEEDSHLQMVDLPFSDIVEETAQSFQSLAVAQQKSFIVQIQPMLMVHGDEKALRQLISILLDNALKYSGDSGNIRLRLEKQGKSVKLSVSNTTEEPIEKESLSHLFDRFYRGDKSRNSDKSGYGIGLSIAKAVVESHKGEICASTADGHSLMITAVL
ncbi:MAG: HAMP domain-containing histidine kinase [Clostridiales bacterium]|nr:HAMP domain-containing histidine kinase [Clostridiales bacterium]